MGCSASPLTKWHSASLCLLNHQTRRNLQTHQPSLLFFSLMLYKASQNNKEKLSHELSQENKRKRFKYQLMQTFWKKLVLFTLIYVTEFNISCIADASLTLKHWVTALYFRIYLRVKLMFEKKQMQLIALGKQWLFLLGITPAPVCPVQGKKKNPQAPSTPPYCGIIPAVKSYQNY